MKLKGRVRRKRAYGSNDKVIEVECEFGFLNLTKMWLFIKSFF
jgi:hypothetical protein